MKMLVHGAQPGLDGGARISRRQLASEDPDAARVGAVEPAGHADQRGLARAVLADYGEDLPGGDRQRHAIDRGDVAEPL